MKNLKKVLALVMAFAMVFTMMATAGAAYTDQADIEATEAVEMLNAIGVMTGDPDGSFRPNDTITRAEACRMIYTIRTNSDNADAYKDMQTTFKDVPSDAWYAGYVKHCQAANIVSGTSATTFEPNRDVTGVELALMCLRVMGYDPAKADIGGSTWSTKTIGLATEAGLLDGVNLPSLRLARASGRLSSCTTPLTQTPFSGPPTPTLTASTLMTAPSVRRLARNT